MEGNVDYKELTELVHGYRAPESAKKLVSKMKVALVVGVASAGKNGIISELLRTGYYADIVTTTSRPMRKGETEGVDYHFIDIKRARENLLETRYFEAKLVHGRVYGTTIAELERLSSGKKIAIGDVDVQGVEEYHAVLQDKLKAIFVIPPDFTTWQERWKKRGDAVDEDEFRRRMISAEAELDFALRSQYYRFVVNDNLARAARVADDLIRRKKKRSYKDDFARLIAEKLHDDIVAFLTGQMRASMKSK